jgi:hypothetical protein
VSSAALAAEAALGLQPTGYDDVPDEFNAQQCDGLGADVVIAGSNVTRLNAMTFSAFNFSIPFTVAVTMVEVQLRLAMTGNASVLPARLYIGGVGLVAANGSAALVGGNELRVLEAPFNASSGGNWGNFVTAMAQFSVANSFLFERSVADLNDPALGVRVLFAGLDTPNDTVSVDCVAMRVWYDDALVSSDIVGPTDVTSYGVVGLDWSNVSDAAVCDGSLASISSNQTSVGKMLQFTAVNVTAPTGAVALDGVDLVVIAHSTADDLVGSSSALEFVFLDAFGRSETRNTSLVFSRDRHTPYYRLVAEFDFIPTGSFTGNLSAALAFYTTPGGNDTIDTGVDCAYFVVYWSTVDNATTTTTAIPTTATTSEAATTNNENSTTTMHSETPVSSSSSSNTTGITGSEVSTSGSAMIGTSSGPHGVFPGTTIVADNAPGDSQTLIYVGAGLGVALLLVAAGAFYYRHRQNQRKATTFVTI